MLIRGKSQYRIFAYIPTVQAPAASGLIATKFIAQGGSGIAWSRTKGLKVNVADSTYSGATETTLFGNDDGYCYVMDSGNSFDGSPIEAIYESPLCLSLIHRYVKQCTNLRCMHSLKEL